jgi:hypothetical protein
MTIRSIYLLLVGALALGLVGCKASSVAEPTVTASAGPTFAASVEQCSKCHQDGPAKTFKDDVHYSKSISCKDCHDAKSKAADAKAAPAPRAGKEVKPARQDIAEFCGGCHSNAEFMAKYDAHLPTNQMALYAGSAHGKAQAAGNTQAAECVDCHGVHEIRVPSDPQSPVSRGNINATCVRCHGEEANLVRGSRQHANRTNCVMCHTGGHSIPTATTELLTGAAKGCGTCHRGNSRQARTATQMAAYLKSLEDGGAGSKEALAAARRAVHSFNLGAMQRAASAATQPVAAVATPSLP